MHKQHLPHWLHRTFSTADAGGLMEITRDSLFWLDNTNKVNHIIFCTEIIQVTFIVFRLLMRVVTILNYAQSTLRGKRQ